MKNWKKWLWIDKRLPKSNYILRIIVGLYLIYAIWNILKGMSRPEVNGTVLTVASVVLGIGCAFCLVTGAIGLAKKEYDGKNDNGE